MSPRAEAYYAARGCHVRLWIGFDSPASGSYAASAVTRPLFLLAAWWLGVVAGSAMLPRSAWPQSAVLPGSCPRPPSCPCPRCALACGRSVHGLRGRQARALQGARALGGAELSAQAGHHPGAGRGSARRELRHRGGHERQPGLCRRQAHGRDRLRLEFCQGSPGRRDPHREHAGGKATPASSTRQSILGRQSAPPDTRAGGPARGRASAS